MKLQTSEGWSREVTSQLNLIHELQMASQRDMIALLRVNNFPTRNLNGPIALASLGNVNEVSPTLLGVRGWVEEVSENFLSEEPREDKLLGGVWMAREWESLHLKNPFAAHGINQSGANKTFAFLFYK